MEDLLFLHKRGKKLELELGVCRGVKGACNQDLGASMGHGRAHMSKGEGKNGYAPPKWERKRACMYPMRER